ncbi:hypothetical protein [Endozoicomonas ascidiicola]|uniref:hypothetical protein n=1 Tax=Endozoicomonas ascidiicola TaxID=1698521 RepID=UPI0008368F94|nr:hypothetical protein [Endozoicomonas ascidiicola]
MNMNLAVEPSVTIRGETCRYAKVPKIEPKTEDASNDIEKNQPAFGGRCLKAIKRHPILTVTAIVIAVGSITAGSVYVGLAMAGAGASALSQRNITGASANVTSGISMGWNATDSNSTITLDGSYDSEGNFVPKEPDMGNPATTTKAKAKAKAITTTEAPKFDVSGERYYEY